jgi:hypothetical protein
MEYLCFLSLEYAIIGSKWISTCLCMYFPAPKTLRRFLFDLILFLLHAYILTIDLGHQLRTYIDLALLGLHNSLSDSSA